MQTGCERNADVKNTFRVQRSAFNVPCFAFRVSCSAFRVSCSAFRAPCSAFRVPRSAFRVSCSAFRVSCSAFRVSCFVFCVPCFAFRVSHQTFCRRGTRHKNVLFPKLFVVEIRDTKTFYSKCEQEQRQKTKDPKTRNTEHGTHNAQRTTRILILLDFFKCNMFDISLFFVPLHPITKR